jgi:arylsulfatase A-like enzyme
VTHPILPVPDPSPAGGAAISRRELTEAPTPVRPPLPPEGAPNVVLILLDDMGFGASSAFGGPCEMPATERLADGGLRYTRFHTAAMCSPTRAALLTGRNHHSVGFGHLVDMATASPAYNVRRPASAATVARILAGNGYATGAFGKWHQTPNHEVTPVGPYDRWPTGEGFQTFYGFMGGEVNHYHPTLFEGTTPVEQPRSPEQGYHLTEDIVDRTVAWIEDVRTVAPEQRFFAYVPFGATHAPFHVAPEWVDKYRGRFDHGWNRQRELTLERQKEVGVIPREADLAPWVDGVPMWDDLDANARRAAALLMELYAGYAEHTDGQIGRLVDALERLGELDNTLIITVLGDNGASPEGGLQGSANYYRDLNGIPSTPADILAVEGELGSPSTWPLYSIGWALAMDAPYQWTKQMASHYGGTRNGTIVHWPAGIRARGEIRNQWHHVIDVLPTILEAAGIEPPTIVDGVVQQPIEGTAMNYSFDEPTAAERHTTQYFELGGSRGIYHEGWVACTPHRPRPWDFTYPAPALADDAWELYDTTSDWTQAHDLAATHPQKLRELQDLFLAEASRYGVLPLDDRALVVRRGESTLERGGGRTAMTFGPNARRMPQDLVPEVLNRSHEVTARIVVPDGGAEGVICAHGGRMCGWSLYCKDGRLTYCHNVGIEPRYLRASSPLAPGAHEVRFTFAYDGGGWGKGGEATLSVDGEAVAVGRIEPTISFLITIGEGFDVGCDLYTPVTEETPMGRNVFTGTIEWVRVEAESVPGPSRDERQRAAEAVQ